MVREVLRYPHPLLKQVCSPADREEAARVSQDLLDTMRSIPGCVGLAAPQVGEPVRVAVVDVSEHPRAETSNGLLLLVNPRVVRVLVGTGAEVAYVTDRKASLEDVYLRIVEGERPA